MSITRRTFPATLLVATNDETGESFVLRTDSELEEEALVARADYLTELDARPDIEAKPEAKQRLIADFDARQKAYLSRLKRERDAARAIAVEHCFTLSKPSMGQLEIIREEATEYDYSGGMSGMSGRFNELRYRTLLLKADSVRFNGETLSPEAIDSLDPTIGEELANRLARAVNPDRRRLLFTLPPSDRS